MPVLRLKSAMVGRRRRSVNAAITARPRASEVMKFGSEESASISLACVRTGGRGSAGGVDGSAAGRSGGAGRVLVVVMERELLGVGIAHCGWRRACLGAQP